MLGVVLLVLLVIVPLGSSSTVFSRYEDLKLPASQSITLPGQYFIPIEIESLSNSTWLAYQVQSNITVSTALMNANQFNTFNNSVTDDISNSITYQNGTTAQADLQVSSGAYYLVFWNNAQSAVANISFTYITYPFTPYVAGPLTPPEPMGLAAFGLYNVSDNAVPYSIETSQIVGAANISSIQAYNSSAPTVNDTVSGATLQLNAVLVAQDNDSEQAYWIQNTPDFVTNATQVSENDNVWNNTDLVGVLSNQSVTSSNGPDVFPTGSTNSSESEYFYAYGTNNFTYALPFDFKLLLNESVAVGKSVGVQIGMQILQNGSVSSSAPVSWFDNITISDPGVQSAYYYVDGNDSTPIGSYYDAELVFGGEGNLETTNFTQMNATLGLYYLNSTSSQVSPFPSYYSFGGDTGEAADNLRVNYTGNGTGQVSIGTPNFVYFGSASNVSTTTESTSSSSSVSTSSSSTTSPTTSTSTQTAVTSSKSSSSGASEISPEYLLVLVPAMVIIFASALAVGRHNKIP
jgi:thermopsin